MNPPLFTVSLDFELFWGLRGGRTLDSYRKNLDGVRAAVPRILDAFSEAGIHAAWACVGFLFLSGRDEALERLPRRIPSYTDRSLDYVKELEAVTHDNEPYYFAPDLIGLIRSYPHQEIATHTFSHYYCLEEGQTAEDFDADLERAIEVAAERGITIKSIVYPRNQRNPAYDEILSRRGISSYRGTREDAVYRPGTRRHSRSPVLRGLRFLDTYLPIVKEETRTHDDGPLFDIRATRFLRPYSKRLSGIENLKMRRIDAEMRKTAQRGGLYHLWWHPHNFGTHIDENMRNLGAILRSFRELRDLYGMKSLSMAEIARGN
jgi:peptidoglycan/xylan/chitin deacetylase (PgdA/CDA1 family)